MGRSALNYLPVVFVKQKMEVSTMPDVSSILTWLEENVQEMRQSRRKTLAAIIQGAMKMQGVGVLALGHSMEGETAAKHRIKRVDRFLGNAQVELEALFKSLFLACCPPRGEVIVLADWTDRGSFQQLVLSLSRHGRSLPFLWITVAKSEHTGEEQGAMIEAERKALTLFASLCPPGVTPIVIADRGFANRRWLGDIQKRGWWFVQRLPRERYVETTEHIGLVYELGIRRGSRPRDWGWGTFTEKHWGPIRLVTAFDSEADEPWYLVTNMDYTTAAETVKLYAKRMWTEALFRDLKNRNWGMGMDHVQLTRAERYDRHFLILALAYLFLCAFGAVAETLKLADQLKANTVEKRVLSLARIGAYCIAAIGCSLPDALQVLLRLPT